MRRLFFSLYAVVAAALVGFVLSMPWLLHNVLRGELLRSGEQAAMAAQYLFQQALRDVPAADWPSHIEALKAQFGYELDLLTLDQVEASPQNMERLRHGLAALSEGNQIEFMLLPVHDSQYIVRVYLVQQEREHTRRNMQGFFFLAQKQLDSYPDSERAAALLRMEEEAGITFRSLRLGDVASAADRERLRRGDVVGYDLDGPGERYLKRVGETDDVLQIGPFPRYFLESAIEYLAWIALGTVIAIALYLWVRPLWRDMVALDRGAQALGEGKLDVRVEVSTRSPVSTLADTFNAMAQRLADLLKSQKDMADAVSHELCTPISRLRFGVEMLSHVQPGPGHERYLRGILRDVDELEGLVDEALTYSRLTNATAHLAMQEVDLTDWLKDVMRSVQPVNATLRVSSEIVTDCASASFDPQLMARALSNIVRNSLRHARTTVRVIVSEGADHLDLTVEDDGPGIAPDQRQAIFEPFYRIDPSRQRASGGHGLGLAIVKRICDWHRAEVTVAESALGGALFRVRLPVAWPVIDCEGARQG